ncbi:unnamed protein product [Sphagnum balticum]
MSMGRKEICVFQELLADQYVVQRCSVMRYSNTAACNRFCGRVEDSAAAAGIPGPRRICNPAGVASIGAAQLAEA